MTKPTKWHVRLSKTRISLGIRPVFSEPSLCAQWVAKEASLLNADSNGALAIWLVCHKAAQFTDLQCNSEHLINRCWMKGTCS